MSSWARDPLVARRVTDMRDARGMALTRRPALLLVADRVGNVGVRA